jgi:hypothetical protein
LTVLAWEAWAPGLAGRAAWAAAPGAYAGADDGSAPPVAAMPPALRRRAGRNDRLGLEPAYALAPLGHAMPSIFASRHGQVARSAVLLQALAQGQPLSPMDFSLSVHNASAGLFSIARGDRSASTSLAAGGEELAAGLLDAAGQLLEGAPQVLLSAHDEPPPPLYDGHWRREEGTLGLGLRLGPGGGPGPQLTLALQAFDGPDEGGVQAAVLAGLLARGTGSARWARGGRAWAFGLAA